MIASEVCDLFPKIEIVSWSGHYNGSSSHFKVLQSENKELCFEKHKKKKNKYLECNFNKNGHILKWEFDFRYSLRKTLDIPYDFKMDIFLNVDVCIYIEYEEIRERPTRYCFILSL